VGVGEWLEIGNDLLDEDFGGKIDKEQ